MSYIVRVGNLAETPVLRHDEKQRPYCFARVIVSDPEKQEDGSYSDGPPTAYDVTVSGSEAEHLVATATECGNVRVMFAGIYRTGRYRRENGDSIQTHKVTNSIIGVSLRGQDVFVRKGAPAHA